MVSYMKKYEEFIEAHPEVKTWLNNRPKSTQRVFASRLEKFCKDNKVTPGEWRRLDKFTARDMLWQYIQPKITKHPTVAESFLMTLKSWYRNLDGEVLPLDSGRGGKHYLHVTHKKQAIEHIPKKTEMYQIIDMASSLRDKTILLFLFQSGVRVNVLEHILYGDVADHLEDDVVTLKITGRLDYKLRGRDIPFYYTFLNGEGAETLRRYCKVKHKRQDPKKPLFYTTTNKPVSQVWIWRVVKMCVKRASFDPKTISTHTIRKSFRKIVRQTNIDDDDKEQLMGHVIPGSRQAYYDKKDVAVIEEAYLKCNFTREVPASNHMRMKTQIEQQNAQIIGLNQMVEILSRKLDGLESELKTMKKQS